MLTRLEAYGKASAGVSLDAPGAISKFIPKAAAKVLLDFLGIEGSVGAEAFLAGDWKRETEETTVSTINYGNMDESWVVKRFSIERRGRSEVGADSDYHTYGTALARKVYQCQGGERSHIIYASFLLNVVYEAEEAMGVPIKVTLGPEIRTQLNLSSAQARKPGLISIGGKTDYYKLIDHFLEHGVPKSIAANFIKEINSSYPSR